MSFRSALLAATALLTSANAHVVMDSPVPYSQDKVNSNPLGPGDFPCKILNKFDVTKMNNMAVGETQTLKFKPGGAVHGGGACQLSIALTDSPAAGTTFKVIKSIEGGCPGTGSDVSDFPFELPDSIPNGKATFAWTWMPVLSGQPEYYMNCAPIEVTGGASDDSKYKELPDMLVANLATQTTCKQVANTVLKFPDPGSVVEQGDTSREQSAPTGECGATGNSPPAEGGSSASAGQPATSAVAGQPSATPSGSAGQPSATLSPPAGQPSVIPSNPGGVFVPSASSVDLPQSTLTTLVTVTASPSAPAPSAPASGGSTCSENGAIVCNGSDQFGLCDNGKVVWQQVAAGTTCSNGAIQKRGYNGRIARPRAVIPGKDFTPDS